MNLSQTIEYVKTQIDKKDNNIADYREIIQLCNKQLDKGGLFQSNELWDLESIADKAQKQIDKLTLADVDTDKEIKYQIVGDDESDIQNGLVSLSAPIARALIGKEVGDVVEVKTPKGIRSYEVLSVEYN